MRACGVGIAVVVGCGSPHATPPLSQHRAQPTACLPRALRDEPVTALIAHGDVAYLCYGAADGVLEPASHACFTVDAHGDVTAALGWGIAREALSAPAAAERSTFTLAGSELRACIDGRCTSFPSPYVPLPVDAELRPTSLDDRGARGLALYVVPAPATEQAEDGAYQIFADVFDIAHGKRTAHVKLNHLVKDAPFTDRTMAHSGRFVNRALQVGEWAAGPGGTELLVDPVHERGIFSHGYEGETLVVDPHHVVVRDGKQLQLVDTDTLAAFARIVLPGPAIESPEETAAALALVGGSVVVASARPATLATFDVKRGALANAHALLVCDPSE